MGSANFNWPQAYKCDRINLLNLDNFCEKHTSDPKTQAFFKRSQFEYSAVLKTSHKPF